MPPGKKCRSCPVSSTAATMLSIGVIFALLSCALCAPQDLLRYHHLAYTGFVHHDPPMERSYHGTQQPPPEEMAESRLEDTELHPDGYPVTTPQDDSDLLHPRYLQSIKEPSREAKALEHPRMGGEYPSPYQEYEEDDEGEEEYPPREPPPPPSTTVAPEADRQIDGRPYSYYYIGRKLWYIPLYFSLYFVIYVGALIIRAIARHKVTFPDRLPNGRSEESASARLDRATINVNSMINDQILKYM